MALKMLAAYYSRDCDSREFFAGLEIENAPSFEEHRNRYDVILLNMQQFLIRAKKQSVTDYLEQAVIAKPRETYGELFQIGRPFLLSRWSKFMRKRTKNLSS